MLAIEIIKKHYPQEEWEIEELINCYKLKLYNNTIEYQYVSSVGEWSVRFEYGNRGALLGKIALETALETLNELNDLLKEVLNNEEES